MVTARGMPVQVKLMLACNPLLCTQQKKPPNEPGALASVLKVTISARFSSDHGSVPHRVSLIFFPARQNGKSDFRMHRRPAAPRPSYWVCCRR